MNQTHERYLRQANLLTDRNQVLVAAYPNPTQLASGLQLLNEAQILTQENFETIIAHQDPYNLAGALVVLSQARILTEANRALVVAHPAIENLLLALSRLNDAQILTQENFDIVHRYRPDLAVRVLFCFRNRGNLNGYELLNIRPNSNALMELLLRLNDSRILNQEIIDRLTEEVNHILTSEEALREIWARFPQHLLTQASFDLFLNAAQQGATFADLELIRDQILGIHPPQPVVEELLAMFPEPQWARVMVPLPDLLENFLALFLEEPGIVNDPVFRPDAQSTHTASVHQSVSSSAVRLMQSYSRHLELDANLEAIKAFINALDDSPIHQAAKRCIMRITSFDYIFTDSSGISIQQLLVLAWMAIHDDCKRQGTLEDAKALFVSGLYEVQRGYNIDAGQHAEEGPDHPICVSGTFNKIMEKLNGIHSDVSVNYITHSGAILKFPKIAQAHALSWLDKKAHLLPVSDYLARQEMLQRLQQEKNLEPIWPIIGKSVVAALWDEFRFAYDNNPEHPQFQELVNNWQFIDLPVIKNLELKMLTLTDFQEHAEVDLSEGILLQRLEQHSLWANRSRCAEHQNEFDKRYGLIIT